MSRSAGHEDGVSSPLDSSFELKAWDAEAPPGSGLADFSFRWWIFCESSGTIAVYRHRRNSIHAAKKKCRLILLVWRGRRSIQSKDKALEFEVSKVDARLWHTNSWVLQEAEATKENMVSAGRTRTCARAAIRTA
eukprot:s3723_g7.t6